MCDENPPADFHREGEKNCVSHEILTDSGRLTD
jgi:hypothetical protein